MSNIYHTRDFCRKQSNHKTGQLVVSGQSVGLVSHIAWPVMLVGLELSHWVNQAG